MQFSSGRLFFEKAYSTRFITKLFHKIYNYLLKYLSKIISRLCKRIKMCAHNNTHLDFQSITPVKLADYKQYSVNINQVLLVGYKKSIECWYIGDMQETDVDNSIGKTEIFAILLFVVGWDLLNFAKNRYLQKFCCTALSRNKKAFQL